MKRFNCLMCAESTELLNRLENIYIPHQLRGFGVGKELDDFVVVDTRWMFGTISMCCTIKGDDSSPDYCDVDDEIQAMIKLGYEHEEAVWDIDWYELKRRNGC